MNKVKAKGVFLFAFFYFELILFISYLGADYL